MELHYKKVNFLGDSITEGSGVSDIVNCRYDNRLKAKYSLTTNNYGIGGTIFSLCSGGRLFVSVQMWYPLKARIGSSFFHARKKYWSIYDSFATF